MTPRWFAIGVLVVVHETEPATETPGAPEKTAAKEEEKKGCGCHSAAEDRPPPAGTLLLGLLGLFLLSLRRKRRARH